MANKDLRWPEPKGFNTKNPTPEYLEKQAKNLEGFYSQPGHYKLPSPYGFRTTSGGNVFTYRPTDNQPDLLQCVAFTSGPDDGPMEWEDKGFTKQWGADDIIKAPNVEPEYTASPKRQKKAFVPGTFNSYQEHGYYRHELVELAMKEERAEWSEDTIRVVELRRQGMKYTDIRDATGLSTGTCYNLYEEAMKQLGEAMRRAGATYDEAHSIIRR